MVPIFSAQKSGSFPVVTNTPSAFKSISIGEVMQFPAHQNYIEKSYNIFTASQIKLNKQNKTNVLLIRIGADVNHLGTTIPGSG